MASVMDFIKKSATEKKKAPEYGTGLILEATSFSGIPRNGSAKLTDAINKFITSKGLNPDGVGLPIKGKVKLSFDPNIKEGSEVEVILGEGIPGVSEGMKTSKIVENLVKGYCEEGATLALNDTRVGKDGKIKCRWATNVSPDRRSLGVGIATPPMITYRLEKEPVSFSLGAFTTSGNKGSEDADARIKSRLAEHMTALAKVVEAQKPAVTVFQSMYHPERAVAIDSAEESDILIELDKMNRSLENHLGDSYVLRLFSKELNVCASATGYVKQEKQADGRYAPEPLENSLARTLGNFGTNQATTMKMEALSGASDVRSEIIPGEAVTMVMNPNDPSTSTVVKYIKDLLSRYNDPTDPNHETFNKFLWSQSGIQSKIFIQMPLSDAAEGKPMMTGSITGSNERHYSFDEVRTPNFEGVSRTAKAVSESAPSAQKPEENTSSAPSMEEEDAFSGVSF